MDPVKHSSTSVTTSSAENDDKSSNEDDNDNNNNNGVGRSYECNFCKRGFTNAQALGGHMNMHREDKSTFKQKINQENVKSNERYVDLSCSSRISSVDRRQIGDEQVMNYRTYLPLSNPSFQTRVFPNSDLPVWREELFKDCLDENLSLGFGRSPPVEDGGGVGDRNLEENEVDLELRLGHDP
ncbi:hypothetical protein BUALT_Bualt12G0141000 [Buddleja alternifolia]|uniref:C2H2-type domain-containing protein n=1 Tax=Buddleja alternifolia TaxID=168488 RepID=A0AAV6X1S3_9LAMI|nr:hypothetical protein BUALT_Bualt12G0141000 [Buddleja alternifolia]